MSPRWMKMLRDARIARGRLLMIVLALAVSIAAVVTMLSAYTVLSREVPRNYMGTNPASAQLETTPQIDTGLLAQIARLPNIAAAELAATTTARVEVAPGKWLPMRIFVVPDFENLRINTLGREAGSWPPQTGTLLIERSALALSGSAVGQALTVEFRQSGRHRIKLGGVVHDPGLAPAWQEQVLYGYATPQTLARFGQQVPLDLLKIVVASGTDDAGTIESTARALAQWLSSRGVQVHEVRIPPPMQHPHQSQLSTVLSMLFIFSLLVLLLGAMLTATIIGGLLTQQVRQIAIMKSIGASRRQLVGLYLGLVGALAGVALVLALPLGVVGGSSLISAVAELLNLRIESMTLSWQLYTATIVLGLAAPLAAGLAPILAATRTTVQTAIQDENVSRSTFSPSWTPRWLTSIALSDPAFTLALRNVLRRRARFMLTILLLAGAGAMFLTSMNLRAAWEENVVQAAADRKFDLELRLEAAEPADRLMGLIGSVEAVSRVEGWSVAQAALAGEGGLSISRRYPDGGHGSFALRAAPADTTLVTRAMLAGRWLRTDDNDAAVLNSQALTTVFPDAKVGSIITLEIEEHTRPFKVVGIVRDILAPGAVFVTPAAFAEATGFRGAVNAVRIALSDRAQASSAAAAISAVLSEAGIGVKAVLTEQSFSAAQGAHIYILVWALGFIAAMMAVVGLLGLASSLGNSVIERTREFGVMRSLGASSGAVVRSVLYEGLLTGFASALAAVPAAVLPSAVVGAMLESISNLDMSLQMSPQGAALWLAGVVLAALVVSYFPATRASDLSIKQTLDWEYA
jgi:putative ABC transport system permease protein